MLMSIVIVGAGMFRGMSSAGSVYGQFKATAVGMVVHLSSIAV